MKNILCICAALCCALFCSLPAQAQNEIQTEAQSETQDNIQDEFQDEAPLRISSDYSSIAIAPTAPGTEITVNVLVTIAAPELPRKPQRPPVAVSLVIDHSGSMYSARKLEYAIQAGKTLVRNLEREDQFSLIIYDDTVKVLFPMGRITDKERIYSLLDSITADGYTFLSGGLEAGIAQFKDSSFEGVRRVILLSDGLANRGITAGEQVAAIGADSRRQGVNVSAIGLGLDYDEDLMQLLAQRGGGQYYYIKDSEDLPSVFRQELALAGQAYTRELKSRLTLSPLARDIQVHGYTVQAEQGAQSIEISDFAAEESRQMLLTVTFQPDASVKEQKLGTLEFGYTDADGVQQTVQAPLAVILAENEAEAELLNAEFQAGSECVQTEVLLVQADKAQMEAMEALQRGQTEDARRILQENRQQLAQAAPSNVVVAARAMLLDEAEQNLDAAAGDMALQQEMIKAGKSNAYMSAQGQRTGFLLQAGDNGLQVEKLQKALADAGFYSGPVNGVFDAALSEAVERYQQANNLDADGLAGPATMRALGIL